MSDLKKSVMAAVQGIANHIRLNQFVDSIYLNKIVYHFENNKTKFFKTWRYSLWSVYDDWCLQPMILFI